jgi:hypothetical protein
MTSDENCRKGSEKKIRMERSRGKAKEQQIQERGLLLYTVKK